MNSGGINVGALNDTQIGFRMVFTDFVYDIINTNQFNSLATRQ